MIFTSSCSHQNFSIELSNELDISRQFETVEIDIKKIPESIQSDIDKIGVYDPDKGVFLTKQIIDMNQDWIAIKNSSQPTPPQNMSKNHLSVDQSYQLLFFQLDN